MTLGHDVWGDAWAARLANPAGMQRGLRGRSGGRARPQEGGQLGGGQAQLLDEAKVLQRGQRDRLQRAPARQPRDLEHVKAVPVLQLRAAHGAARSRRGPTTVPRHAGRALPGHRSQPPRIVLGRVPRAGSQV